MKDKIASRFYKKRLRRYRFFAQQRNFRENATL